MSLDVNLAIETEKKKPFSKVLVVAIFFAVVSTAIFVGLFFYNFLLLEQISGLEAREVQINAQKDQFLESQDSYILLANKIASIQSIIEIRVPVDARLAQIISQVPSGVEVVRIDAGSESVRVSLESSQLSLLDNFLTDDLDALSAGDGDIEKVDVLSFSKGAEGGVYTAGLLITYRRI